MNEVAERSADELRRLIVLQRREVLALNGEFNRLQRARATASAAMHVQLLGDIDRVADRHRAATDLMDALTDELIRVNRGQCLRTTKRLPWHRAAR